MLDNAEKNPEFEKGGLGSARLLLTGGAKRIVDFTMIVLPSRENARLAQERDNLGG